VDVNGDGKADYCRAVPEGDSFGVSPDGLVVIHPRQISTPSQFLELALGWGVLRCNLSRGTTFDPTPIVSARVDLGFRGGWGWIDINGDRIRDFCRITSSIPANGRDSFDPVEKTGIGCIPLQRDSVTQALTFGTDIYHTNIQDYGDTFGRAWVDFNGDGLGDFCRVGQFLLCSLSDSKTFSKELVVGVATGDKVGRAWVDVNGDGFIDFCYVTFGNGTSLDHAGGSPVCRLGNGKTVNNYVYWPDQAMSSEFDRFWIDVNGDGISDFCALFPGSNTLKCSVPEGRADDLLVGITNSLGGTTEISYLPSTRFANVNLPVAFPVLHQMTMKDGRGGTSTRSFDYEGGFWSASAREFRGFSKARELSPAGPKGQYTITSNWFHQGDGLDPTPDNPDAAKAYMKGKTFHLRTEQNDGLILSEELITYRASTGPPESFYNPPKTAQAFLCGPSGCKQLTTTQYEYDDVGNVTRQIETGLTDGHQDFSRMILREFAKNPTKGILGLLSIEAVYEGAKPTIPLDKCASIPKEGLLTCFEQYYDYPASRIPEHGHVTLSRSWLDTGESPEVKRTYGPLGQLLSETDPNGNRTLFEYDSSVSFLTKTTTPSGLTSQSKYYGINGAPITGGIFGQVQSHINANGQATTMEYDSLGRTLLTKSPDGGIVRQTYFSYTSPGGQRVEETDSVGGITTEFIDGSGRSYRQVATHDGSRKTITESQFDARGLIVRQSLPYFPNTDQPVWIENTFDAAGRNLAAVGANGGVQRWCYDGPVTTVIDALGRRSRTIADSQGHVIGVELDRGRHTSCGGQAVDIESAATYRYDDLGRLVSAGNRSASAIQISYDSLGRRRALNDPNSGKWLYEYDAASNLGGQVDPLGTRTNVVYDAESRVTSRKIGIGPATIVTTYEYDGDNDSNTGLINPVPNGNGRLRRVRQSDGYEETYNYDNAGRTVGLLRRIRGVNYRTNYAFDTEGRPLSIEYPDGMKAQYRYKCRFLEQIEVGTSVIAQMLSRTALGQSTELRLGNGMVVTKAYCANAGYGLCSTETRSTKGTVVMRRETSFDLAGQITAIQDPFQGGERFSYNDVGELVNAAGPYGELGLSYDAQGNITADTRHGGLSYRSAPPQQGIADLEGKAVDYNARGAETFGPNREMAYDANGQPIEVKAVSATTRNTFSPSGDRLAQQTLKKRWWPIKNLSRALRGKKSVVRDIVYVESEYRCDSQSCEQIVPIPGVGWASRSVRTGSVTYFHSDYLGSLRMISDQSGSVLTRVQYSPYGVVVGKLPKNLKAIPLTFAGHEFDEGNGLILMGARYYDPAIGRFVSADVAGPNSGDPLLLNRFAYGRNNPISLVDPKGEMPVIVAAFIIGAVIGGVSSGINSDWNGDAVIRGALIGGISASVGSAVGLAGGHAVFAAMASGGTGAALGGGSASDIARGAALGAVTFGMSRAGTSLLRGNAFLGTVAGVAATAAITGDDVGRASVFAAAGYLGGAALSSSSRTAASSKAQSGQEELQGNNRAPGPRLPVFPNEGPLVNLELNGQPGETIIMQTDWKVDNFLGDLAKDGFYPARFYDKGTIVFTKGETEVSFYPASTSGNKGPTAQVKVGNSIVSKFRLNW